MTYMSTLQEGLYEEAQLLREREMDLKAKLSGAAAAAPVVPVVGTLEIEAIVSAWTGIPVDRLSAADTERLSRLPDALTVCLRCDTVARLALASGKCFLGLPSHAVAHA